MKKLRLATMTSEKVQEYRNSGIELLRIICIFGIITMHMFGDFYSTCTGPNLLYGVLINSIFNMGVSCFMLITGYFGAIFSTKKVLRLELLILFYSIFNETIISMGTGSLSFIGWFKSFLPITTKKYWYMSCYIIITCFSSYINNSVNMMDKKQHLILLSLLFIFFYLMPSFGFYEIMNDGGKGIANMLTIYLTGKYIKKYYDQKMPQSRIKKIVLLLIGCNFLIKATPHN